MKTITISNLEKYDLILVEIRNEKTVLASAVGDCFNFGLYFKEQLEFGDRLNFTVKRSM